MKDKVKKVLYSKFEDWAIQKAVQFKKMHSYKCKHISVNELSIYSLYGLSNAIQRYNATYSFCNYATIYINSELYNGLTALQPLNIVPPNYRKKKHWKAKYNNKHFLQTSHTIFVGKEFDKYVDYNYYQDKYDEDKTKVFDVDEYKELWTTMYDKLQGDPFLQRVFTYKYCYDFDEKYSNKKITNLMCCSKEKIRQSLHKIKKILY
jgi:hypothetical protein